MIRLDRPLERANQPLTAAVLILYSLILLALLSSCGPTSPNKAAGGLADAAAVDAALRQTVDDMGLTPLTPIPSPDPALVALGQALFFETELSGNRDISCATCHNPQFGGSDGLPLAIGTGGFGLGPERQLGNGRQFVPRNSLDIAHRGRPEWTVMFWDGRITGSAASGFDTPAGDHLPGGLDSALAVQAMLAVVSRHEMRGGLYDVAGYTIQPGEFAGSYQQEGERPLGWSDRDIFGQENELAGLGNTAEQMPFIWAQLMVRLQALPAYPPLFAAAYPGTPPEALAFSQAANALAAFQTAAFSRADAAWDRYLAGDEQAITLAAKQGALLFYGRAGCAHCHAGPLFTDQQFHNIGAPQLGPGTSPSAPLDYGRYEITGRAEDRFAFRTPSLRNVAVTAPYLHNGAYHSLAEVINHHLNPEQSLADYDGHHLSPTIQISLQNEPVTRRQILTTLSPYLAAGETLTSQEVSLLVAFLETLTDSSFSPR